MEDPIVEPPQFGQFFANDPFKARQMPTCGTDSTLNAPEDSRISLTWKALSEPEPGWELRKSSGRLRF